MSKIDDFVRLIDNAIAKANALSEKVSGTENEWMAADSITARTQFERLKQEALVGSLVPSKGAGLGMARALGEWAPDDLYEAGAAVENYYRQYL